MSELTHFNEQGRANMVDVTEKTITHRTAVAAGEVHMAPETLAQIKAGSLKKGDVLYWEKKDSCHYAVYLGDGKLFEASGGDDNKKGSKKWNNSIHIRDIDSWGSFQGAFRYVGSVNATCFIYHGEISKRVYLLQEYLNWYSDGKFFKECGPADGIYGDNTFKWCCRFQEEQIGKGEGDGIVGPKTIAAMERW